MSNWNDFVSKEFGFNMTLINENGMNDNNEELKRLLNGNVFLKKLIVYFMRSLSV